MEMRASQLGKSDGADKHRSSIQPLKESLHLPFGAGGPPPLTAPSVVRDLLRDGLPFPRWKNTRKHLREAEWWTGLRRQYGTRFYGSESTSQM